MSGAGPLSMVIKLKTQTNIYSSDNVFLPSNETLIKVLISLLFLKKKHYVVGTH